MLIISHRKLFLFSRYLSFCLDFLVMQQNGLIRKIRLLSNFMMSQPSEQAIVIHIMPNISRSKDNQMHFLMLRECNIRNIFLEISYRKCGGETTPTHFCEKLKLSIALDQQSKALYSLFLLYAKFLPHFLHTF